MIESKRIPIVIGLMCLIGLWGIPSLAQEKAGSGGEKANTLSLGLGDSIRMALEDNPAIISAKHDLEGATIALEEARAANLIKASPVTLKRAEIGAEIAQEAYDMSRKQVVLGVKAGYYGLLRAMGSRKISERSYANAKDNLRIVQDKLKVGNASELDLLSAQAQLAKAEQDLVKAQGAEEKARLSLLKSLQLDFSTRIELADTEFSFENWDVNIGQLVEQALGRRIELRQAAVDVEISQLEVELAQNEYTPPNELKKAQIKLGKSKEALRQKTKDVTFDIWQSYINLIDAKKAVEAAGKALAQVQENYRASKLNFEAGIITQTALAQAEIALMQAELGAKSAIFDYDLAKIQLKIAVNSDLEDILK
ncbi:MAG: TolC family protein [bacterium]